MPIVQTDVPVTSARNEAWLRGLAETYPMFRLTSIGASPTGRPLWALTAGTGPRRVLYTAAHHANEWITALILLKFAEDLAADPSLVDAATVTLIPLVNPDGVDLVTGAIQPDSQSYADALRLSENYPTIPFPSGWKANLNGVDLNLQYPAGWLEAREIKFAQGFTRPGPRDYVGRAPLTQPEARALYDFTDAFDPALVIAYHTQGGEIYWQFRDYATAEAKALGEAFAEASGYVLADTPYASSFAGYKDWFLQRYRRPGYTVEAGRGQNPLPLADFPAIYRENLPILKLGITGLVSDVPPAPQDTVT